MGVQIPHGRGSFQGEERARTCPTRLCRGSLKLKAKFHSAIQLANQLASVMEFGISRTIKLASSSLAGLRPPGFRPVADRFAAISTCRDSSNLVLDRFAAGLRPASQLVCDQLASWSASRIEPDTPNTTTTLSSSLADRKPAREPAREQVR